VQNRVGKTRRNRLRKATVRAWKKAVVKLKPDHKINIF
jgi:ribosomal protein L23